MGGTFYDFGTFICHVFVSFRQIVQSRLGVVSLRFFGVKIILHDQVPPVVGEYLDEQRLGIGRFIMLHGVLDQRLHGQRRNEVFSKTR